MDATNPPQAQALLDEADAALAFGEYRQAQLRFAEAIELAGEPLQLSRAVLGAASSAAKLDDKHGMLRALEHSRAMSRVDWPTANIAEVCLLEMKVRMAQARIPEVMSAALQALESAAKHLGHYDNPAPDSVAVLIESHPDRAGAELLAAVTMALVEIHALLGSRIDSLVWFGVTAKIARRSYSLRAIGIIKRLVFFAGLLDLNDENGEADQALFVYFGNIVDGDMQWISLLEQMPEATPADAVAMFEHFTVNEAVIEALDTDAFIEYACGFVSDLDEMGAHRLAARMRLHCARVMFEKALALAKIERQQKPLSERLSDEREGKLPSISFDKRMPDLLLASVQTFNQLRADSDAHLIASLTLLAELYDYWGNHTIAELIAHYSVAVTPAFPALRWRACWMLAQLLGKRGAQNAAAFWAKAGVLGLAQVNFSMSAAFASEAFGRELVEPYVKQLVDLLRRIGRIKEAAEISAKALFGEDEPALPWTVEETQARDMLVNGLAQLIPAAPLDLDENAAVHDIFLSIERCLSVATADRQVFTRPMQGVAVLTVVPVGSSISLQLLTASWGWSATVQTRFTEQFSLAHIVESVAEHLASPPSDPCDEWGPTSNLFAQANVDEIGQYVIGSLPHFDAQTVVVEAAGVFRFLPWAAMNCNGNLVDRWTLLSCPATTVAVGKITRPARIAVLALEDSKLDAITEEVESLRQLEFGRIALLRTGAGASPRGLSELLTSDATILHLATHCEAHSADPAETRLYLADGAAVTLGELASRDLSRFELVTLAACASGLPGGATQVTPADLLHAAGVPLVLTALWPVDDAPTGLLMRLFYQGLCGAEGLTPQEALRRAQIQVRKQHPRPYFWAGFQLSGLPAADPAQTARHRSQQ